LFSFIEQHLTRKEEAEYVKLVTAAIFESPNDMEGVKDWK
jgi:hypothetical protein